MPVLAQTGRLTTDNILPVSSMPPPGVFDSIRTAVSVHHTFLVLIASAVVIAGIVAMVIGWRVTARLPDHDEPPTSVGHTWCVLVDGLFGWRLALSVSGVALLTAVLFVKPFSAQQSHTLLVGGVFAACFTMASAAIATLRSIPIGKAERDACAKCGYPTGDATTCPECGSLYGIVGITLKGEPRVSGVWLLSGRALTPASVGVLVGVLVAGISPLPATVVGVRYDAVRIESSTAPGVDVQAWMQTAFRGDVLASARPVRASAAPWGGRKRPMLGEVFARDYTTPGAFTTIQPALFVLRRVDDSAPLEVAPTNGGPWSAANVETLARLLGPACEIGSEEDRRAVREMFAARLMNAFGSGSSSPGHGPGGSSLTLRVRTSFWSWVVPIVAGLLGWFASRGIARKGRPAG